MTASIASARIDGLARPPDASSPLPSRSDAPRSSSCGDLGEHLRAHHRGAQLGQLAFGQLRVLLVDEVGDDEAEHRVAEELEALVRLLDAVLRAVRAVGQRAVEEAVVDEVPAERELQPSVECRVDGTAPPSGHQLVDSVAASRPSGHASTASSSSTGAQSVHDVVDRVAHGLQVAEVFVVDAEADGALAELLLERLDQLDRARASRRRGRSAKSESRVTRSSSISRISASRSRIIRNTSSGPIGLRSTWVSAGIGHRAFQSVRRSSPSTHSRARTTALLHRHVRSTTRARSRTRRRPRAARSRRS